MPEQELGYKLEFKIHELPPMGNAFYAGMPWGRRKRLNDKFLKLVFSAIYGKKPKEPLKKYQLKLVRASSSEPDYDGLVVSFKLIVDALVDLGVLENDKLSQSGRWEVEWVKEKPKKGWISITVSSEF